VGAIVLLVLGGRALIEQGAARVGAVPHWATAALLLVAFAIVALTAALAGRVPPGDVGVHDGLVPLATVAAMLVTATILSPQYVSWLLPFAAIAATRQARIVGGLTFAIAVLSTLGLNLVQELNAGDTLPMVVVVVRNVLLVVLLVVSIRRIASAARAGRPPDTSQAPRHRTLPVPVTREPAGGPAPVPVPGVRRGPTGWAQLRGGPTLRHER
jgi:hypothetical protein